MTVQHVGPSAESGGAGNTLALVEFAKCHRMAMEFDRYELLGVATTLPYGAQCCREALYLRVLPR